MKAFKILKFRRRRKSNYKKFWRKHNWDHWKPAEGNGKEENVSNGFGLLTQDSKIPLSQILKRYWKMRVTHIVRKWWGNDGYDEPSEKNGINKRIVKLRIMNTQPALFVHWQRTRRPGFLFLDNLGQPRKRAEKKFWWWANAFVR